MVLQNRYRRKISQSRRGPLYSWRNQSYSPVPTKQIGNHATEPSTVGHVMSEQHRKSTFDFTEIVNNYGLKRGTICQIVRFISEFFLKLYMQFWKYFHSVVLGSVGRSYCGKNRVLEFLARLPQRLL